MRGNIISKDEILAEFGIDFEKALNDKGGEYLYADINKRAKKLIFSDRNGIIDVCKYWISLREEPYTLLAVDVIMNLKIVELRPELEYLKKDIESEKSFRPYYNELVDNALNAIS